MLKKKKMSQNLCYAYLFYNNSCTFITFLTIKNVLKSKTPQNCMSLSVKSPFVIAYSHPNPQNVSHNLMHLLT